MWTAASTTTQAREGDGAASKTGESAQASEEGKKEDKPADGEKNEVEQGADGAEADEVEEKAQLGEDGPTPSFALLDIQGNVVVTCVPASCILRDERSTDCACSHA